MLRRTLLVCGILASLLYAAMTFADAAPLAAGLPMPWLGVWERVNIGVFLLWAGVRAAALLRSAPAALTARRREARAA